MGQAIATTVQAFVLATTFVSIRSSVGMGEYAIYLGLCVFQTINYLLESTV